MSAAHTGFAAGYGSGLIPADAQALLAVRQWWLDLPEWHEVEVMQARMAWR